MSSDIDILYILPGDTRSKDRVVPLDNILKIGHSAKPTASELTRAYNERLHKALLQAEPIIAKAWGTAEWKKRAVAAAVAAPITDSREQAVQNTFLIQDCWANVYQPTGNYRSPELKALADEFSVLLRGKFFDQVDTKVRASHIEATGARNDPRNFDLSDWDQIDDTWWCIKSGEIEIHLSSDPGLSWEVSQMKQEENIVAPLYIPIFGDAYAEAVRLYDIHEKARVSSVRRP